MDWVTAHRDGVALALAGFATFVAVVSFLIHVEPGPKVTVRTALLLLAVVAVASAGFVFVAPATPTPGPVASEVGQPASPAMSAQQYPATASSPPWSSGSSQTAAGRRWLHDPPLQAPVGGLPGFIQTVSSSSKQGDANQTLLEVSLDENEILVISGSWAKFPNPEVGTVGLNTNCYMVIARGPMTWTGSPRAGEFSPIVLPPSTMAGWHVDRVDATAETHVWTNEWVASLAKAGVDMGPCTKGAVPEDNLYPGVDLWELS